ncbi:MerR family transcriptional regulator [uncultured Desulfovibrio sp.]|uniref:MerR family transcriptional regulator n=1 Tax=uncultured Desulfovibrio sp. TaxID=167968 RepID=UPI002636C13C|nr:MerR family transcriptional regulator [uncultured Desulfovibrio sp.]
MDKTEGFQRRQAGGRQGQVSMADMQQTVPQVSGQWAGVAYVPQILRSMVEIKKVFRVSEETVQQWILRGAPIVVEYDGRKKRYSTEVIRLQIWRERNSM